MNYNLTVKEFVEIVNKNLESLKGKNPMEYKSHLGITHDGISGLVENVMENMEIYLPYYNVNIECCKLFFKSYYTDNKLVFATIKSVYKQDKRTTTGYGNKLESIKLQIMENIPLDWALLDLKQYMEYHESKELYIDLMEKQKELVKQFEANKKYLENCIDAMKIESYDIKTELEVDKCYRQVREMKL